MQAYTLITFFLFVILRIVSIENYFSGCGVFMYSFPAMHSTLYCDSCTTVLIILCSHTRTRWLPHPTYLQLTSLFQTDHNFVPSLHISIFLSLTILITIYFSTLFNFPLILNFPILSNYFHPLTKHSVVIPNFIIH